MRLAHELELPLVTVIDTAGAALSKEAEEGGLAGEIARCLAELVMLDAPDGLRPARPGHRRRGARADARRPGDLRPALLAVAAAARGRVGDPAPRHRPRPRARRQPRGCAPSTCSRDGIVDRIVAEHPDAADEPADFCAPDGPGARARARRCCCGPTRLTRRAAPAGAATARCG